jgi:hypothetical protein
VYVECSPSWLAVCYCFHLGIMRRSGSFILYCCSQRVYPVRHPSLFALVTSGQSRLPDGERACLIPVKPVYVEKSFVLADDFGHEIVYR